MNKKTLEKIKYCCGRLSNLTHDINFGFKNRKYWANSDFGGASWSVVVYLYCDDEIGESVYAMHVYRSYSIIRIIDGLIEAIEKLKSLKAELMQTPPLSPPVGGDEDEAVS